MVTRGEDVDQAGWTWDLHSPWLGEPWQEVWWVAELFDGPFTGHGEGVEADTLPELLRAIEERSALLREILAEREAGL
jgi:hypothetical protein